MDTYDLFWKIDGENGYFSYWYPFDFVIDDFKYFCVRKGNRAKYEQNLDLKEYLLQTGNSILGEASLYDKIWGIGCDSKKAIKLGKENWPGQNKLGKILMELRTEFSQSADTKRMVVFFE